MYGKQTLRFLVGGRNLAPILEVPVSLVDGLQQVFNARNILDRPHPCERVAESVEVALGEQANCNDAFVGQTQLSLA